MKALVLSVMICFLQLEAKAFVSLLPGQEPPTLQPQLPQERPESLNSLIRARSVEPVEFPFYEVWLQSGYKNPEFFVVHQETLKDESLWSFDYTSILLRGSGATLQKLEERLPYTKDAFDTCKVQIQKNWIVIADPPNHRVDFVHDETDFDNSDGTKAHLALITPRVVMPGLFYVRSFVNAKGVTGTSAAPFWAGGSPQENFTWVTEGALDFFDFSIEAHELGHVLADTGHGPTFTGDIMSAGPNRNNRFSKSNCQRIWDHPLVRRIEDR